MHKVNLFTAKIAHLKKYTFLYKATFIIICISFCHLSHALDSILNKKRIVYKLKPWVDVPIVTASAAWAGYMLTQIYSKGASTTDQILSQNINSINPLDRLAVYPYNQKMDKMSYYPFYAAFPLPIALILTGKRMRNDFLKIKVFCIWNHFPLQAFLGGFSHLFCKPVQALCLYPRY